MATAAANPSPPPLQRQTGRYSVSYLVTSIPGTSYEKQEHMHIFSVKFHFRRPPKRRLDPFGHMAAASEHENRLRRSCHSGTKILKDFYDVDDTIQT